MRTLLEGLRYSKYAILRKVVENEFADDVPEAEREIKVEKSDRFILLKSTIK